MLTLASTLHHAQVAGVDGHTAGVADGKRLHHAAWIEQARAANWQIDASQLERFDSSVLALLLDLRRSAIAAKSQLVLHHPPQRLMELAKLYGIEALIANPQGA